MNTPTRAAAEHGPAGQAIEPARDGTKLLLGFLIYEFACQLLLLVPSLGSLRVLWRTAAFAGSLALLVLLPGRPLHLHPARTPLTIVVVLLAISAVNPAGGGVLASVAHFSLYLAILGPLFWVARMRVDARAFELLLITMWAYNSLSAAFGVLQVFFPGEFQPPLASILAERGPAYLDSMRIELANGAWVLRPMGLTDTPGGAASAGFYATLLGLGLVQAKPRIPLVRWLSPLSILMGAMVVYLAQVRSIVVILGVSILVMVVLQALAGRLSKMLMIVGAALAVGMVAYALAIDLAGDTVSNRLATLAASSPGKVYYTNRGIFLEHTFTELLPRFPLGAGLGRWGMMNAYFGSPSQAIWVEIQWTGWLLDGGLLLILAYLTAVVMTLRIAFKAALSPSGGVSSTWSPLMAAYGIGVFAVTFNAAPFIGTGGVEFWLLNAAFFQALRSGTDQALAS